jgi:hypothetical protein
MQLSRLKHMAKVMPYLNTPPQAAQLLIAYLAHHCFGSQQAPPLSLVSSTRKLHVVVNSLRTPQRAAEAVVVNHRRTPRRAALMIDLSCAHRRGALLSEPHAVCLRTRLMNRRGVLLSEPCAACHLTSCWCRTPQRAAFQQSSSGSLT